MYLYMKYHGKLFTKCKAGYRMIQLHRLIAHCQGAVHTAHTHARMHTHMRAHTRSLLGRRVSTLHNLAASEMFVLMPQALRRRQSSKVHGIRSHQGIASSCMAEVCLQGSTAQGGRGGEGGFEGLGRHPGELSWARGQESELGGRLMLERKSENVAG